MSVAHSDRAHARLSASGAKRWLSCPPSVKLEDQFEDSTSAFAEEGTLAHEISEIYLAHHLKEITKPKFTKQLNDKKKHELFAEDMIDYVERYVDIVIEKINEAKARSKDALVLIEERLDFSEWVPEGFGTGDVLIVSDGMLEIVDLKYGKGVPVSAEDNPQMRLYGVGALAGYDMLYGVDLIKMTIVQPRLDSVSSEEMKAADLYKWVEEEVKAKALQAFEGEGEFNPGEHCRFCKAKGVCRARADKNLEIAKYDFKEPDMLSTEEIGQILLEAEEIQKWAKDIQEYALKEAKDHGTKFDGWKLVEGRSSRKYTDVDEVAATLQSEGYGEEVFEKKLLAITKLEKELGKKRVNEILSNLIEKPPGKPTLAQEHDKRPEINSLASAEADFS